MLVYGDAWSGKIRVAGEGYLMDVEGVGLFGDRTSSKLSAIHSNNDRFEYDLTRKIGGSIANFLSATCQQIYIELKKLDKLGFVHFLKKKQKGKPDKKIYSDSNY